MKNLFWVCLGLVLLFGFQPAPVSASTLASRLSGKILLQVEQNGEAWYIYPGDQHRYYLGRPADAFSIMRTLGYGITNANLMKIPVAVTNLSGGIDMDGDGLKREVEDSFGSSDLLRDTDADNLNDYEEISYGFSPINAVNTFLFDSAFSPRHKGKIFLQVQSHGEAWYIDTTAYNRHYLGRPADAFTIMRNFGLGISDADLAQIPIGGTLVVPSSTNFTNWQPISQTVNGVDYIVQCPPAWEVDYASDYGGAVSLTQCSKIYAGQYALDDGITVSVGYVPTQTGAYYEVNGENYSTILMNNVLHQDNVSLYTNNSFSGYYSMANSQHTFRFLARRTVSGGYLEVQAIAYGSSQTDSQYLTKVNQIIDGISVE